MNCPKCGSSVGKNDEYCGSCGYHLVHNGGTPAGQGPHKKNKKSGLLIFTVILEIAAIVAVVCVIFFGFSDKKDSSSDKVEVSSSENEKSKSNEKSESKKSEKDSGSEDKKEAKAESDASSNTVKSSGSAGDTESAEPAPNSEGDTESAEPAPDSEGDAESAEPAPDSEDDAESAEPASDSEDDTESAEPAPDSEDDTEGAEPAPDSDSADDTDSDEAASETADSKEAEQSEAYLIADNTDLLDEIKRTYTRITEAQVTSKNASSTIEQDLVENDALFVLDDDDTTNWQEGVSGPGIGEHIDFTFDQSYPVEYMTFKLGNWKTEEYYNENYRPKTLNISVGDKNWIVTFADEKQEFLVQLDPEVDMNNIKITIQDVYDSHVEWDDTPITEIGLWYKQ